MAATNTNCLVGALVACIILLVLSLNISRGGRMPSRNEFVNSMPTLTSWVQDESAHEELEALRARVRSLELRLNAKFTAPDTAAASALQPATTVAPVECVKTDKSLISDSAATASSPLVGSSRNSTDGLPSSSSATDSRFFWPKEATLIEIERFISPTIGFGIRSGGSFCIRFEICNTRTDDHSNIHLWTIEA